MKNNIFKKFVLLLFVGTWCLVVACIGNVAAGEYPEKPIKLIHGYAPGGGMDLVCRSLGSFVSDRLGQSVVIVSKAGASGTIAAAEVASSEPDGYTLGSQSAFALTMAPLTMNVKFDTMKDIEVVMGHSSAGYGLCVLAESPWKSLKELIEFARKNPNELTISGNTVNNELAFGMIAKKENITWKHVPYQGGAPATTALLGGHVKATLGTGSHYPFVESKKFRMLAVYMPKRHPLYPDVPTFEELGYTLPFGNAQLIIAPKGVPEPILKKLEEAFLMAAKAPAFEVLVKKIQWQVTVNTRAEMNKLIASECKAWSEVVKQLGVKKK